MSGHQRTRHMIPSLSVLVVFLFGSTRPIEVQAQSPFLGSVPTGQTTGEAFQLSLKEAFDRALKYNLGVVEG